MNYSINLHLLSALLKERDPQSHKNDYGNALLVAGSRGMMGAALLSARACMRSGVGLLTARVPRCGYDIMQLGIPEAKCETDAQQDRHSYIEVPNATDALAIGPGLGQHPDTQYAVQQLLERGLSVPGMPDIALVIDADGLNILSLHPELFSLLPKDTLLTPHPGEARRIFEATGLSNGCQLAMRYGITVVLKGHQTNIYVPNGNCYRNDAWGNAGMAVGGSGDVLTGILLALRAQGYGAQDAAILGVALHAMAADIAIEQGQQSEESLLPSDIIACLGQAFNKIRQA